MCKAIVFAGTTEGRRIAEFLDKREIPALICVATEYGEQLLPSSDTLEISHERLSEDEMERLIAKKGTPLVIDATHPYAAEATENIKKSCEKTGASYVRVLRESGEEGGKESIYVNTAEEAAAFLEHTKGNILVTTGSKEAEKFTALSGYKNRVFLRALSLPNVVRQCAELGFEGRNLICMQGPFSAELNAAMIRQLDCKYLVTKMSGSTGGFQEKLEAAKVCGCTPVIIGRPSGEDGISLTQCKRLLCERFALVSRAEITLAGIGMGSEEGRTAEADRAIREAELLIGAKRMLDACQSRGKDIYEEYDAGKIADYIREHPEYEKIVIVLSGDTGFYSGAKKLLQVLGSQVRLICGISSPVYFMSRIGKSWDDVLLTSSHGKDGNLPQLIRSHEKVFSILGTKKGIRELAEKLVELGLDGVRMYTGERLSYDDEIIRQGSPKDFLDYEADSLSVVYAENPHYKKNFATHGIPDGKFFRDKAPMTKEEVRAVSLSKLRLYHDSVCYDVGAGTGSVSVEMALRALAGKVYAIEKKPSAIEVLRRNKEKFALDHMEIIEGTAPAALEDLEPCTHAFIGGSSGNMKEIIRLLLKKNPGVRIVINCITLETIAEVLQCLKELPLTDTEIVQIAVSKSKSVAGYHMMNGENPIYIISCTGTGAEKPEE